MATFPVRGPQIRIGISWLLQLALAYTFFRAGYAKMVGDALMVQIFDLIGFGQWFRYVSGVVELTGAVLILLPRVSVLGGLWLMATMFVAVLINLVVTHTNPLFPTVLFALATIVVALRYDQLLGLYKWVRTRLWSTKAA